MNKLMLLTLAGTLATAAPAQAQTAEKLDAAALAKIRDEGMNRSQVMQTAFYLTDVNGPRLANSDGLKRANEWTKAQLAKYGLANANIEAWGDFGRGWDIEKSYVAMTAPYYHALVGIPKAWTPSTPGPVRKQVVVMKAATEADLAQYKGQLRDKIVVMSVAAPLKPATEGAIRRYSDEDLKKMAEPAAASTRPTPDATMLASRKAMVAMRTALADMLVSEGAAGVLSARGGIYGTFNTSNGAPYAADAKPALPEIETAPEDQLRIIRLVEAGVPVEVEMETKTRFQTQDLKGYNVVAEIPGTDKKLKSEVVMLGGHLDSWHAATGATDNAAGCAVMMEAVRILKASGLKPRRTIRIALWGEEEEGLHGSRGYVKNHFADPATMQLKPEHEKLAAYFNLDNGAGKIRGIYAQGNEAAAPIFQQWLAPFADLGASTVTLRNTGSTDHIAFDAVGLPGFQFIQDGLDYFPTTHHTNQDTYDRLIADDLKQASVVVASFVYDAAMRDQKLPRKPLPAPAEPQ
ncbi:M20/M25/M40 family metallo-hydrolase [Hymenobacter sp. M29]|uniref:Carboxypeptidase Q n=1 Tax=Hymenobacter mellowenesis TaxID=3063995 RepID=A0ABT9AIV1_9BACT|nr:M20/M25/M40 family metallo-hydrolase [Hymenobacter sp. M29]MDO7849498.1 M20/M25/M40 family metallo-hydrolase [Hymenobacter sp. M29]